MSDEHGKRKHYLAGLSDGAEDARGEIANLRAENEHLREIVDPLNRLREAEGRIVHILHPNAEFGGPQEMVRVTDYMTGLDVEATGETLAEALERVEGIVAEAAGEDAPTLPTSNLTTSGQPDKCDPCDVCGEVAVYCSGEALRDALPDLPVGRLFKYHGALHEVVEMQGIHFAAVKPCPKCQKGESDAE